MLKVLSVVCLLLSTFPAFSQPVTKYELGTIMAVKPHTTEAGVSDDTRYDISLKVGGTMYLVLYTPTLGMSDVKYWAGRDLLVFVGEKTVTFNDVLGHPREVRIISRKAAADAKRSK
jgi:hypothetical protein